MDIEKFIDFVKGQPVLYDYTHSSYKDNRAKNRKWKEIAQNLGVTIDVVKGKWKNLRDCYGRYLKSQNTTTGQAAGKYKFWQWSKQMEFLRPHLCFAQTITNLSEDSEPNDGLKDFSLSSSNTGVDTSPEAAVIPQQVDMDTAQHNVDHRYENVEAEDTDNRQEERAYDIHEHDANKSMSSKQGTQTISRKRSRHGQKTQETVTTNTDKVLQYLESRNREKCMDATKHIFLGYAKTITTFSPRR